MSGQPPKPVEQITEPDLSTWFSTYGILTAERVLERFHIRLQYDELLTAVKNPMSVYYMLLRVPLKNLFNGIILQQAHDYQVYAQKLFVDYGLSEETMQSEESPGAATRESLAHTKKQLIEMNTAFRELEFSHQKLISESQRRLIDVSKILQTSLQVVSKTMEQTLRKNAISKTDEQIQQAVRAAMVYYNKRDAEMLSEGSSFWEKLAQVLDITTDAPLRQSLAKALTPFQDPRDEIEGILSTYLTQAEDLAIELRGFRIRFYELIIRATELLKLLPSYRPDLIKEAVNRESLQFDSLIGEI